MRSVRPGQQARPPTKHEARGALRRAVVSRTEPGGAPLAVVEPGSSGDSKGSGSLTWPQPRLRSPLCPQHAVLWGGGRAWTCRSPSGGCALPLTCPPVSRDDPSPVAGTGRRPRPSRRGRQTAAGRAARGGGQSPSPGARSPRAPLWPEAREPPRARPSGPGPSPPEQGAQASIWLRLPRTPVGPGSRSVPHLTPRWVRPHPESVLAWGHVSSISILCGSFVPGSRPAPG